MSDKLEPRRMKHKLRDLAAECSTIWSTYNKTEVTSKTAAALNGTKGSHCSGGRLAAMVATSGVSM